MPITMYGAIAAQDLFGADQPREHRDRGPPDSAASRAVQWRGRWTPLMTRIVNRKEPVRAEARPQSRRRTR